MILVTWVFRTVLFPSFVEKVLKLYPHNCLLFAAFIVMHFIYYTPLLPNFMSRFLEQSSFLML